MRPTRFVAIGLITVPMLAGCNSPDPASNEIAKASAESNAVIEAAKNHPALSQHSSSATGKPLPPLPGVNTPAPETSNTSQPEHHHPEQ
jgi:hypothetical protein